MQNNTNFLEDIFNQTLQLDLCKSQEDFSKRLCGKSKNYFAVVKNEQREPSVSSLLNIAFRLDNIAANQSGYKIKNSIRNIHTQVMKKLTTRTLTNAD